MTAASFMDRALGRVPGSNVVVTPYGRHPREADDETEKGEMRKGGRRAVTVSMIRYSRRKLARETREINALMESDPIEYNPPKSYGDCQSEGWGTETPCPWVRCKHHLFLEVDQENGSIKLRFPDKEIDDESILDTCALAVADKAHAAGGMQLEQVGARLNVTRERVRQIEYGALRTLADKHKITRETLLDLIREEPDVYVSSVRAQIDATKKAKR